MTHVDQGHLMAGAIGAARQSQRAISALVVKHPLSGEVTVAAYKSDDDTH
jgi:hypothetical protein